MTGHWAKFALVGFLALAACAEEKGATQEQITAAAYSDTASPPSITLMTMISNDSGAGGHTAVLINASQRVIWDPAGTWRHPTVPERGDVLYGINDQMLDFYLDYHARPEYRVVMQTKTLSPEEAERIFRAYANAGPAAKAMCANTTTAVLKTIPGFENIPHSFFPRKVMKAFGNLPGVSTAVIFDEVNEDKGLAPGDYKRFAVASLDAALAMTPQ